MPRKPAGKVGPFVVKQTLEGLASEWAMIDWPSDKPSQERFVMDCFVEKLRTDGFAIDEVIQNDEDDFDFRIRTPSAQINVDLTEFVYFEGKGNPFAQADGWINCLDCANALVALVNAKSEHYGRAGAIPIDVIVYATHWRFRPDQLTIALAKTLLRSERLTMEHVFLVLPLGPKRATVYLLYPTPNDVLGGKSPEDFKDERYLPFDPGNFKVAQQP